MPCRGKRKEIRITTAPLSAEPPDGAFTMVLDARRRRLAVSVRVHAEAAAPHHATLPIAESMTITGD